MQRKEEKISDTKSFSRTRRFTKTRWVISLGLIVLVVEAPHPSLSTKLSVSATVVETRQHFHAVGRTACNRQTAPGQKRRCSNHRQTNRLCSFVSSAPCSVSKDGTRRALEDRLRQQLRAFDVIGQKRWTDDTTDV